MERGIGTGRKREDVNAREEGEKECERGGKINGCIYIYIAESYISGFQNPYHMAGYPPAPPALHLSYFSEVCKLGM